MGRKIAFNDFFDRPNTIAFVIPGKYAKWWGGLAFLFVMGLLILNPLFANLGILSYAIYWSFFPVAIATHAVLIGSEEYKFLSKFHKPKEIVLIMPKDIETKTALKPKIGSLRFGSKGNERNSYPAVDLTDLVCPIQINLQGHSVGGYLIESNKKTQLVFAYKFEGFSSTISASQAQQIAETIQSGFRDYSGLEKLTLHYGTFSKSKKTLAYLDNIEKNTSSEEGEFFLHWQKRRFENLTKLNRHAPKTLTLYYSYTIDALTENTGEQRIEKFVSQISSMVNVGKRPPVTSRLETDLGEAFQFGFLAHQRFFKKVGFTVQSTTWKKAWKMAWERINDSEAPEPSLYITLSESGLEYNRLEDDTVPVSAQLFEAGAPTLRKDAVFLPGKNKWVGGVVLNRRPRQEWDVTDRLRQLEFACEALLSEETFDTELIIQFTSADQNQALRKASALTKDSNLTTNIAAGSQRIDKGAEFNLKKSEGAEEALRDGGSLIKTAWVANIYRDSLEELTRAILTFTGESCFNGNIAARETGYYDTLWLETLPFTWKGLLQGDIISSTRFERRITETTEAAVAFMPVLLDTSRHSKGIIFISKGARTPLFFDPFGKNPHGHTIISGFTGSGKTQLIEVMAEYTFCTNRKFYFFDADKGTGAGALEDITHFVGGSYFKASEERSNIFEGVDWRLLDETKENVGRTAFKSFLINSLRDLAFPQEIDAQTSRTCKDLLSLLVNDFLIDPSIQDRYRFAWDNGLKSHEWGNIPCLPDFIEFASLERLPFEMQTTEIDSFLARLRGSLKALTQRSTGRAISLPSTFDRSSRFMVFSLGATGDDDDNLPLILSAQGTMLFGALASDETLIAQDEASRLFPKFPSIADNCADLYAMGRSLGIWMALLGQDLNSIASSPVAESIFQNTATYLTGYIQGKGAIEALVDRGIPQNLLLENMSDTFFPASKEGARRWLISQGNRHFYGDLYPSFASVGLTMNGPSEQWRDGTPISCEQIRQEFFDRYPNKFQACNNLALSIERQSIDAQVVRYKR